MIAVPPLDYEAIDKDAFRDSLLDAISVFGEIDLALQIRVVEFLISGRDAEVLLDVREALRQPNKPQFFTLKNDVLTPINAQLGARLLDLFRQKIAPAGYYQRLGQFCSQHPQLDHAFALPDAELPQWFNDLIRMATTLSASHDFTVPEKDRRCDCGAMLGSLSPEHTARFLRLVLLNSHDQPRMLSAAMGRLSGLRAFVENKLDDLLKIARNEPALGEPLLVLVNWYRLAITDQQLSEIIDYGLAVSRFHRSDFQSLLERHRENAKPWLLERLNDGTPQQRQRAAQWLDKIYGKSMAGALGAALAKEMDKDVRAIIEPLFEVYRQADEYESKLAEQLAVPAIEVPTGPIALPDEFTCQFKSFIDQAIVRSRQQYKELLSAHAQNQGDASDAQARRPIPPTADEIQLLYAYMEGTSSTKPRMNQWLMNVLLDARSLVDHFNWRQVHWFHCMRLLEAIGSLQEQSSSLVVHHGELLAEHRRAQVQPYGLRELDAAAEQMYGRPHLMSRGYLMNAASHANLVCSAFTADDIWPAFVKQLKLLEDSIAGVPLDEYDRDVLGRRKTALAIAGMLPVLPRQLADAAWALALGDAPTLRPLARPLLASQPDCLSKAIAALACRSGGARMGAAEFLQELGRDEAIEPLKKALKKEKQRPVQGVLLAALEKLRANVDEFIGRDKLLECAIEGARRPLNSMMWFPMDELPRVRWAVDDQPLEPIILRWWLTQCVFFKSTTCSPVMRRALELCRRDDTLQLARFVLEKWIGYDSAELVRNELKTLDPKKHQGLTQQSHRSSQTGISAEQLLDHWVRNAQQAVQRQQSAYTERGMLAIVAAFGDEQCVELIEQYLLNYQGNRSRQTKCLLEVISQIDSPSSRRVICSLAVGFRHASIGKRAQELMREMGLTKNWMT